MVVLSSDSDDSSGLASEDEASDSSSDDFRTTPRKRAAGQPVAPPPPSILLASFQEAFSKCWNARYRERGPSKDFLTARKKSLQVWSALLQLLMPATPWQAASEEDKNNIWNEFLEKLPCCGVDARVLQASNDSDFLRFVGAVACVGGSLVPDLPAEVVRPENVLTSQFIADIKSTLQEPACPPPQCKPRSSGSPPPPSPPTQPPPPPTPAPAPAPRPSPQSSTPQVSGVSIAQKNVYKANAYTALTDATTTSIAILELHKMVAASKGTLPSVLPALVD